MTQNIEQTQKEFLPRNPAQAAQILIKVSRALLGLAERETQALVQNDLLTFSILQDEKEMIVGQYTRASEEFRGRIEDFRGIDRNLLNQLEDLQKKIAENTRDNNVIVEQIQSRASQNTHKTLLTAQELGQMRPLHFANNNIQQEGTPS